MTTDNTQSGSDINVTRKGEEVPKAILRECSRRKESEA